MNKFNQLSREEMKVVLGGVTSPEVFLEMCLAGQFMSPPPPNDGSVEDHIIKSILETTCYDAYNQMP